jgi:ubiquinone/menaquinone biosynthesis C-methylase UbiE
MDIEDRITATVAAYDAAAEEYQAEWRDRRLRDAVRTFGGMAGRGARILDVACGPALDVRLLRDAGLKVVAGDLSHAVMRVAKMYFPKGSLARWDFRTLPFPDDVFDGIWAPEALHHVPRAQIRSTLAEWRRVQRKGPIFLTFQEGDADLEVTDDPPAGKVYATRVTVDQMKALLLAAGYVDVEVETRPDLLERSDVTWLYGWGRMRI